MEFKNRSIFHQGNQSIQGNRGNKVNQGNKGNLGNQEKPDNLNYHNSKLSVNLDLPSLEDLV